MRRITRHEFVIQFSPKIRFHHSANCNRPVEEHPPVTPTGGIAEDGPRGPTCSDL
jgi:hypothetical protein